MAVFAASLCLPVQDANNNDVFVQGVYQMLTRHLASTGTSTMCCVHLSIAGHSCRHGGMRADARIEEIPTLLVCSAIDTFLNNQHTQAEMYIPYRNKTLSIGAGPKGVVLAQTNNQTQARGQVIIDWLAGCTTTGSKTTSIRQHSIFQSTEIFPRRPPQQGHRHRRGCIMPRDQRCPRRGPTGGGEGVDHLSSISVSAARRRHQSTTAAGLADRMGAL